MAFRDRGTMHVSSCSVSISNPSFPSASRLALVAKQPLNLSSPLRSRVLTPPRTPGPGLACWGEEVAPLVLATAALQE